MTYKRLFYLTFIMLLIIFGAIFLKSFKSFDNNTGAVVLENNIIVDNVTRENTLNSLMIAEKDIEDMSNFNLSTYFVRDLLLKAKRSFIGGNTSLLNEDIKKEKDLLKKAYLESLLIVFRETPVYEIEKLDYSETIKLTRTINLKKQEAYDILDALNLLKEKEKSYRERIDTSKILELIEQAEISLREERYEDAESYLKETDTKLEESNLQYYKIKTLINSSKNFFVRNWWQSLSVLLLIIIITPFLLKKIKIVRTKNRLNSLRTELKKLDDLIKSLQKDYFEGSNISKNTYEIRMNKYRERINEIKHTIPVLESIINGGKKPKKDD